MGFLSYGSAKGLSTQHDFQKDIENLYKAEAYKTQVRAEKEQKARYYAGLMKEHSAVAPSMVGELEGFYKDLNNQIADFAIENPNFETDVTKMQQFHNITDQYLNNQFVRKDIQSQEQFELFKGAINAGDIDKDSLEYDEEMERYTDWMENGGDGYVFSNPQLPTYGEIMENSEKVLHPDVNVVKFGDRWENVSETPLPRIQNQANTNWLDPKIQKVLIKTYDLLMEDKDLQGLYDNAFDWHVKALAANEAVKKTHAAWDPKVRTGAETQAKARKEMMESYPHYSQSIGANFQVGKKVKNHNGLECFTPFAELNKPVNFGEQGIEIFIRNEKTGILEPKKLKGEFALKNCGDMTIDPTTGGIIECEVRTTVNSVAEYTGKKYKVTEDGEFKYLDEEELEEWKKEVNFNKRELDRMAEGKKGHRGGINYSYEPWEDATGLGEYYNSLGFSSTGIIKEAMMPDFEGGGKSTFPTYAGKIYVSPNVTTPTLLSYEKVRGGGAHVNKVHQYGRATTKNFMREQTDLGNYEFAAEFLNDTYESGTTHYYTESGNEATSNNYSKKIVFGSWVKDPNYSDLYFRINSETEGGKTIEVREGYDLIEGLGDY